MFEPLKGIKILDCTRLLPYQYCTMILGDLGGEVLKIEEPREGDYGRWGDPERTYESKAFTMTNRNKKSMKLNLKSEKGKEIFKSLAVDYDVIIESFRPGVMDRLGVGYEEVCKVKPDIIYCSTTGYGQTGPYKKKAGHDVNYLSYSGILADTGNHTGRPVIPGIPFGDMTGGGIFTALAVMSALLGKERTGKGQYIDVAQTDVLTSLNILGLAECLAKKEGKLSRPFNIRGASLCYNTFKTADHKFIALGAIEDKFWLNFCKAIDREDLVEEHSAVYDEESPVTIELKNIFSGKTQREWVDILDNVDTCFSPVLSAGEALENKHLKEREMITTMDDPARGEIAQVGFPARFSEGLNYMRSPVPYFGEHTKEVLTNLGYTLDQMKDLKDEGVV